MLTSTEVNPKSWTQHLLFICKEEHELRTERKQKCDKKDVSQLLYVMMILFIKVLFCKKMHFSFTNSKIMINFAALHQGTRRDCISFN